jgi:hypothetical protein
MSSAQAAIPAVFGFCVLICAPCLMLINSSAKRQARARYYGRRPGIYAAGIATGVVTLAVCVAVAGATLFGLFEGQVEMGRMQAVGAAAAWVAFWFWVVVGIVLRRGRSGIA